MDTDAKGQLGGMDASAEVRRRFAGQSRAGRCATCGGKTNEEIMREQEEAVKAAGGENKKEEVPDELRLAYREDLGQDQAKGVTSQAADSHPTATVSAPVAAPPVAVAPTVASSAAVTTQTVRERVVTQPARVQPAAALAQRRQRRQDDGVPAWVDKAILGVLGALAFLICRKVFL